MHQHKRISFPNWICAKDALGWGKPEGVKSRAWNTEFSSAFCCVLLRATIVRVQRWTGLELAKSQRAVEKYWTDGQHTALRCTIARPTVIHQSWTVPRHTHTEDNHPIFRKEVEAAVRSLKKGKSAGVDNIPAELVQGGGEDVITALTTICNKIWHTGEWPTPWITLPKKGNL